jgi:hypothetical protein
MKKAGRQAEPSRAALMEMPEVDFKTASIRRNPFAKRIAREGFVHVRTGRPRKGEETGPTVPRSVRFPAPVWKQLEKRAKSEGITLHAALRAAIIEWVGRSP